MTKCPIIPEQFTVYDNLEDFFNMLMLWKDEIEKYYPDWFTFDMEEYINPISKIVFPCSIQFHLGKDYELTQAIGENGFEYDLYDMEYGEEMEPQELGEMILKKVYWV